MSLYFDNNKLFDAEGHLTDEGLYAIKDGTLDDLGALEAAEHLSFCDYCLLRYTAMIDAAPDCMKQPMRDLIPQVQSLMRLRSFRIMTNRYVSAAAAVVGQRRAGHVPPLPGGKGQTSGVRKAAPHPALRCRLPPRGEGIVIHADTAEARRRGFSFRGAGPAA